MVVSTWAGTNGIGTTDELVTNEYVQSVTTPTQVGTATNWISIAAGGTHSLAVKSDGSLYAWGENEWFNEIYVLGTNGQYALIRTNFYGVLGLGNMALRSTNAPTRVGTDSDWVKVAAGDRRSFAIKKDGSLWAWGDNGYLWQWTGEPTGGYAYAYGRLGLGTNVISTNVPTQVGTDNNWIDVSVSGGNLQTEVLFKLGIPISGVNQQCLGLKSDGSLWTWGYNWNNIIIIPLTVRELPRIPVVPTRVGMDNDWVAIAAGSSHNLALKSDGSLWAWGANDYGQLGSNNGASFNPVQVGSLFTWGYLPPMVATDASGADYDGDGLSDFVLYDAASGTWMVRLSSLGYTPFILNLPIGGPGYRLVTADVDGDGKADPVVYQESTGTWQGMLSGAGYISITDLGFLGGSGYAAAAADYDGDRKTDGGVYLNKTGEWRIRESGNAYLTILKTLGNADSISVPADYDGCGCAELAVYQLSTGTWNVMLPSGVVIPLGSFGGLTYVPTVADYDGDGKADPAIYEPSTGRWRIKLSSGNYWEYDSAANGIFLGGSTCIPVSADYDGDGKSDPAVYDLVTGKWTILLSKWGYHRFTTPW